MRRVMGMGTSCPNYLQYSHHPSTLSPHPPDLCDERVLARLALLEDVAMVVRHALLSDEHLLTAIDDKVTALQPERGTGRGVRGYPSENIPNGPSPRNSAFKLVVFLKCSHISHPHLVVRVLPNLCQLLVRVVVQGAEVGAKHDRDLQGGR